jgi:predicted nucleic acid-binding protein
MTSYLIDVNLWIAMTWGQHRHHREAMHWSNANKEARFLFCRFTMLGFLRLLTNQMVMGEATLRLNDALGLYDAWMEDPRVQFAVESRNTESFFRQAVAPFAMQPATSGRAQGDEGRKNHRRCQSRRQGGAGHCRLAKA